MLVSQQDLSAWAEGPETADEFTAAFDSTGQPLLLVFEAGGPSLVSRGEQDADQEDRRNEESVLVERLRSLGADWTPPVEFEIRQALSEPPALLASLEREGYPPVQILLNTAGLRGLVMVDSYTIDNLEQEEIIDVSLNILTGNFRIIRSGLFKGGLKLAVSASGSLMSTSRNEYFSDLREWERVKLSE